MNIELKVPTIGESITEVEIGAWLKAEGERVEKDEPVVALESEKATVELPAPESGTLKQLLKGKGSVAKVGEVIGYLETAVVAAAPRQPAPAIAGVATKPAAVTRETGPASADATPARVMPAAQIALDQHGLRAEQIRGTGPGGRILKEDVLRHVAEAAAPVKPPAAEEPASFPLATRAGAEPGREE
ncbi:MAG TPA: biotin/lipoyl-containing protein, partial [Verrucomicrobiae bacterium]